jgi:hypothetical protein
MHSRGDDDDRFEMTDINRPRADETDAFGDDDIDEESGLTGLQKRRAAEDAHGLVPKSFAGSDDGRLTGDEKALADREFWRRMTVNAGLIGLWCVLR